MKCRIVYTTKSKDFYSRLRIANLRNDAKVDNQGCLITQYAVVDYADRVQIKCSVGESPEMQLWRCRQWIKDNDC